MAPGLRRVCGLLLAAAALLVFGPAAAQAAPKFTSSQYPATIKGSQVSGEEFTFTVSPTVKLKCEGMQFEGSIGSKAEAEESSFSLPTLVYSVCVGEVLGSTVPFTLTMGGCSTVFSLQEAASGAIKEEGWEYTGGIGYKCPEGQKVGLTLYASLKKFDEKSPLCVYTVAPQSPIGSVDYKLDESGTKLTAKEAVTGIAVTKTFGTLVNCGKSEPSMSVTGRIAFELFNGEGLMQTGSLDP